MSDQAEHEYHLDHQVEAAHHRRQQRYTDVMVDMARLAGQIEGALLTGTSMTDFAGRSCVAVPLDDVNRWLAEFHRLFRIDGEAQ